MSMQSAFGIAAGALSLVASLLYFVAIIRNRTKPNTITWWVFSLLHCSLAISLYASGANDAIWLPAELGFGSLVIAILSLRYGDTDWKAIDVTCIIGVAVGYSLWWFLQSPLISLFAFTATEFTGLIPTIAKALARPWTEDVTAWGVGTVASALNLFAVPPDAPALLFYPGYMFVTSLFVFLILFRPRVKKAA